MLGTGQFHDDPKYGLQFRLDELRVAATPYYEAVSRALARRIRPFRRSNQDYTFEWMRENLTQAEVLKVWRGDLDFLRSSEHQDPMVKKVFLDL